MQMALSFQILVVLPCLVAYVLERRPLSSLHTLRQLLGLTAIAQGRARLLQTTMHTRLSLGRSMKAHTPQTAPLSTPFAGPSRVASTQDDSPLLPAQTGPPQHDSAPSPSSAPAVTSLRAALSDAAVLPVDLEVRGVV